MPSRRTSVLAIAAVLLAGCGGSDSGEAADETATLSVWIMEGTNPDAEPFFEAVSADFTADTGATLDVQYVPWASAHDKFVTSIAGGTGPDVAEVGTTWTPEFGEAGALADLTDRVRTSGTAGDLVDGLVASATVGDALYGMPWYAGVRSVVYRADIFAELGLSAPTTWAEWVSVGTAIKAAKPDMVAMPVAGDNEYGVYPFIWGAGGQIATQSGQAWASALDSPEAREGIAFYTGLATEHGLSTPAATTWKETDLVENFAAGKVAMMLSGSWTPKTILAKNPGLEGKIGVFTIPGPDGGYSPSFVGGSHLAVFENSKQKDLAWSFIELMSTKKYAGQWAQQSSYFPGLVSLLAEAQEQDDPLVAPFAVQLEQAGDSVPVTPAYGQVQGKKTIPAMLQSILSGTKTVEQATKDAAAEMDGVLGS